MQIIIEGADGSGKSTIVNHLAEKYNCDIVRMTKWGSRNLVDYKAKLKLKNIISDRSFLSEIVCKTALGLMSQVNLKDLNELMLLAEKNDWKFIILTAPTHVLEKRLIDRGDEESEVIKNIGEIDHLYRVYSRILHIPLIDTSKADYLLDIEKEIEND